MVDRVSNEDAEVCAHNHVGTAGRDMILALLDERNALAKQRDELAAGVLELKRQLENMTAAAQDWMAKAEKAEAEVDRLTKLVEEMQKELDDNAGQACDLHQRAEKAEAERDAALAREALVIEQTKQALAMGEAGYSVSYNPDAQAALDKLIADARADAFRDAAELVKKHPMRFAGQTEAAIRASLSVAILARINEPQEDGAHD